MKFAVVSEQKTEYSNVSEDLNCANLHFIYPDFDVTEEDWSKYDAVFLVNPFTEKDALMWTGHPHVRCFENAEEFRTGVSQVLSNIETERKLLIKMPDIKSLQKYKPYAAKIEQIYLTSDMGTHRIRRRETKRGVQFFETLKIRITSSTCNEYEGEISEDEYNNLKQKADKDKRPINKIRYCFIYKNQYFELDVYDFWKDKATLELEVTDVNKDVLLPPEIALIKDVTDDFDYKNSNLAGINYEDC